MSDDHDRVHHYYHLSITLHGDAQARPPWADEIIAGLSKLTEGVTIMAGELDTLTAQVAANTDAEASAVTLLGKLSDLIKAGASNPAAMTALAAQLATSKDALAAAIVANTPAA